MSRSQAIDFIDFDSLLGEQEKLVRQTARRFVDELVLPVIKQHFRDARFPMDLVPEMANLGFFGANLA
jgi:alkylation response protein AidB-like acyl-CoA dehydrogenase